MLTSGALIGVVLALGAQSLDMHLRETHKFGQDNTYVMTTQQCAALVYANMEIRFAKSFDMPKWVYMRRMLRELEGVEVDKQMLDKALYYLDALYDSKDDGQEILFACFQAAPVEIQIPVN